MIAHIFHLPVIALFGFATQELIAQIGAWWACGFLFVVLSGAFWASARYSLYAMFFKAHANTAFANATAVAMVESIAGTPPVVTTPQVIVLWYGIYMSYRLSYKKS